MNLPVALPEMTQAERKEMAHYVAQGRMLGLMDYSPGRINLNEVAFVVTYVDADHAEVRFLTAPDIRSINREVFLELAHAGAVERIDIDPRGRYAVAVIRQRNGWFAE